LLVNLFITIILIFIVNENYFSALEKSCRKVKKRDKKENKPVAFTLKKQKLFWS